MAESSVTNGVNVEALLAAREVLRGAPQAAKFTWRASCKWKNGTHSQSKVEGFYGLGAEQKVRRFEVIPMDRPCQSRRAIRLGRVHVHPFPQEGTNRRLILIPEV